MVNNRGVQNKQGGSGKLLGFNNQGGAKIIGGGAVGSLGQNLNRGSGHPWVETLFLRIKIVSFKRVTNINTTTRRC